MRNLVRFAHRLRSSPSFFFRDIRVGEPASERENHLPREGARATEKKTRGSLIFFSPQRVASPRGDFRARSRTLPLDYPEKKNEPDCSVVCFDQRA